jgi:septum formation protein
MSAVNMSDVSLKACILEDNMVSTKRLLLASESPRRREMLSWLNVGFQTTRADVDEHALIGELPADQAIRLALAKAHAVQPITDDLLILSADTIVDYDQLALGKPSDASQARTMLHHLREGMHQVHTGLAILDTTTSHITVRRVTTNVWMRPYTDTEIDIYVASGDPMDKAGAYAIQHKGFHPVQRLDRCYANVVGLPLCALVENLRNTGIDILEDIQAICLANFAYNCPRPDKGTLVWQNE